MQHIEFFHNDHFENNYHRVLPPVELRHFIDFFWETKFDSLWKQYPKGFSDAQFPNIGYTYIINLGSPFVMQVDDSKFNMKTDGFLPRHHAIECFHKPGNHFFGIKFRISPVLFEKDIDFSKYRGYVFPLSYLLDTAIIQKVKREKKFDGRIKILSDYFLNLLETNRGAIDQATIVSEILNRVYQEDGFNLSLEGEAKKYNISLRTLQRYFEKCTGASGKQAIQLMRIRKAVVQIINDPSGFSLKQYGYFDKSHFYKHLKLFMAQNTLQMESPHLKILSMLKPAS